jgi:type II secretory pathway pseudopilin PulG
MKNSLKNRGEITVLDTAIVVGLMAIFAAIATPLLRGAILRQHMAECAQKVIRAADAFDLYAASFGGYPQSQRSAQETEAVMRGAFAVYEIDWWAAATDLGGQWNWYSDGRTSSVVIAGSGISESQMIRLDRLLDDGNLETGAFQHRGSRYHYIIRDSVL